MSRNPSFSLGGHVGIEPFLSRSVSKGRVEFLSGLHVRNRVSLGTISLELLEQVIDSLIGDTETRNRIDNDIVSPVLEVLHVDVRSLAEFSHVGKQERTTLRSISLQRLRDNFEFFSSVQAFREDHVRTSIDVQLGSLNDGIETFNRSCVGSGANNEFTIGAFLARIGGDLNLLSEILLRNKCFSVQVAASLREDLIFNV